MIRWLALALLVLPFAAHAKPPGPRSFDVHTPPGFADRLVDSMATYKDRVYTQHPNVTGKMTPEGMVVKVDTVLLHSTKPSDRQGIAHILSFGVSIHAQSNEPGEDRALREALAPFGADKLLVTPK